MWTVRLEFSYSVKVASSAVTQIEVVVVLTNSRMIQLYFQKYIPQSFE